MLDENANEGTAIRDRGNYRGRSLDFRQLGCRIERASRSFERPSIISGEIPVGDGRAGPGEFANSRGIASRRGDPRSSAIVGGDQSIRSAESTSPRELTTRRDVTRRDAPRRETATVVSRPGNVTGRSSCHARAS